MWCASWSDIPVGPLAERPWREAWREAEGGGASPSMLSVVGIPKPGNESSWPASTSPNSCRPPDTDGRRCAATFAFVDERCGSMVAFVPFVRRLFRGVAGAAWGLSRGFRLVDLCGPYAASLLERAAEAVDDMEALARL